MLELTTLFSKITTYSAEETFALGKEVARHLKAPQIIYFEGSLGSGKTTFIKGLIHALTTLDPNEILSPTFTYLIPYEGPFPICHFDLYRLSSFQEFEDLGFYDYLDGSHLCLIEWASKLPSLVSQETLKITFSQDTEMQRTITFSKLGGL